MIEGLNIQAFSGRKASTSFGWADKVYKFALPVDQILELQELTDRGPYELLLRFREGRWRVQDIRHTIRLGLIGGGEISPGQALTLVSRYVDARPYAENVPACLLIMTAATVGVPDDTPPKSKGARRRGGRTSQTASSAPPSS